MTAPEPAALDRHSIGLFLDVDGTIIDLAPTPDAVDVPTALLQELASAERRLDGALALVSGRPIKDLDRLFKPLRLRASGVHGGEIRFAPDEPEQWLATDRLPDEAWERLQRIVAKFPGAFVENKGISLAVHYRLAGPVADEIREALRQVQQDYAASPLEVVDGR